MEMGSLGLSSWSGLGEHACIGEAASGAEDAVALLPLGPTVVSVAAASEWVLAGASTSASTAAATEAAAAATSSATAWTVSWAHGWAWGSERGAVHRRSMMPGLTCRGGTLLELEEECSTAEACSIGVPGWRAALFDASTLLFGK